MKKFKVAIIGCGRIGYENDKNIKKGPYSHYKAVMQNKNFQLIAVAEINKNIRQHIAKNKNLKVYSSYEKLLKDNIIDLIIVATPDETHFKILKDIAQYKPKFVICEKPLTNSILQTHKIIKLYRKHQIHLSVNFSRRYSEYFMQIKEKIDNKNFGKILRVDLSYSRGFFHNAVHWLDLIMWFFGEPKKIYITRDIPSKSYRGDRTIDLIMMYKFGLLIRLNGLDIDFLGNEEFELIGTQGRVRINPDDKMVYYELRDHKVYNKTKIFKCSKVYNMNNSSILRTTLNNVKDILVSKNVDNLSPAQNTLDIFKLLKKSGLDIYIK